MSVRQQTMHYAIAILSLCPLTGCQLKFGDDFTVDESTFTEEHIKTIERVSRLDLPEGVRGLNMFYQGSGIDDALIAKLRIPEPKVPELKDAISAVKGTKGSGSASFVDDYDWWTESQMDVNIHRKLNVKSDYLELILGQVDRQWILLVKWFST